MRNTPKYSLTHVCCRGQGGSGYARKISFKAIKFDAVYNPIIIDQYYCPTQKNCITSVSKCALYIYALFYSTTLPTLFCFGFLNTQTSAVKLSDISFIGIMGTSRMDNVINLSCSKSVACTNIVMDRVYIRSVTPGRKVFGTCINAYGRANHVKPHLNCLN